MIRIQQCSIVGMCIVMASCTLDSNDSSQGSDNAQLTSSILEPSECDLENAYGKITYIGEQTKPVHSIVFSTADMGTVIEEFPKFQKKGKKHGNDALPTIGRVRVEPTEFSKIVSKVKGILEQEYLPKTGKATERRILSFVIMYGRESGQTGEEFFVTRENARDFYDRLVSGFDLQNNIGRKIVTEQFHRVVPKKNR